MDSGDDAVGRLVAGLNARISQFARSGNPSVVLDPAALDEAERLLKAARPADGDLHVVPVDILTVLAYLHLARYQVLPEGQDQDDLRTAMGLFAVLAVMAPERVPDRVRDNLAAARPDWVGVAEKFAAEGARAFDEYHRTGRPGVLEVAVAAFQDAVKATPPGQLSLAGRLADLGTSLLIRFERAGDSADLDAAIDLGQRAVAATPPGDPRVAGRLSSLGNSLRTRFEHTGDPADLDAAIDAGRQAVAATRPAIRTLPLMCRTWGIPCAQGSNTPGIPRTWTPRSTLADRR